MYKIKIFLTVTTLMIISCNKDSKKPLEPEVKEHIKVTGVILTSQYAPDGDGSSYGEPSYPMPNSTFPNINAFPNPFVASNRWGTKITFNHLPEYALIEIYGGVFADSNGVIFNQDNESNGKLVEVLEKDNNSQFLEWELVKSDSSFISSGFYRAYVKSANKDTLNWVDIYIINAKDCKTWVDVTNWLPNDWDVAQKANGEKVYLCK